NIGDSRCYLVQPEGISRITRDHSLVEDLVARGQITPEQARQHPQKNLITRALGAEAKLRADLYRQDLTDGDALLLCSDGLSNTVTDQELLYEVLHGGPGEDCCRRLLDIALSRGAPDNVTAVLLQM
ncbi:MAG TPA: SpoIIE family protein phosphatase, partial [Candidatus Intestinimonas stercorigallinarum]|nr:SpoIIE family protein phosphatase [Candidatus Intestinimonas stercorigallinarum]